VVKISKGEKQRSVGMVDINLADFIVGEGQKDNSKGGQKLKLSIDKCPDKDAFIEMQISSSLIN